MKYRIVSSFWLVIGLATIARGAPLNDAKLSETLDSLIEGHATSPSTTVCLKVVDLQSGTILYDRHGERLLTPASNLKIYTSACVLDVLGPEHRFKTQVKAMGEIKDQVLYGNLVLVGGGDSMLTIKALRELAKRVVEQWGIQKITGSVQVENTRYASPLKGPGWMWDDDPDYYNMPITPLMLDFNVMQVRLSESPDGLLSARLLPASRYPPIEIVPPEVLPGSRLFWRAPSTEPILLAERGDLEKWEEDEDPRITPLDPGKWVASVFQRMLVRQGVEFNAEETSEERDPQALEATKQLEVESPTLFATLKHFDHESENAVGEVLLHEIAIAKGVSQPTWGDGAKAITSWLVEQAGLKPKSFRLVDGSGLSRYNLISADSSVVLLAHMHGHRHFLSFFSALPEYEVKLKGIDWLDRPPTGFDTNRVRAKPGGMSGVSTISGYLRTLDGRLLAFSLLANGFIGSNEPILDLRNQVWQTLVQYRRD